MRKNRKKSETYRFNGNPFLHAGSIHPVKIGDLESGIRALEAKLADHGDTDDKRWTARWLRRYRWELAKKRKGLALKQRVSAERRPLKTRVDRGGGPSPSFGTGPMSRDTRQKRYLHALNDDGMVLCNPRDKEAAHRAEMEEIATDDRAAVTCRKCRSLLYKREHTSPGESPTHF
jgi:hypothetical protein